MYTDIFLLALLASARSFSYPPLIRETLRNASSAVFFNVDLDHDNIYVKDFVEYSPVPVVVFTNETLKLVHLVYQDFLAIVICAELQVPKAMVQSMRLLKSSKVVFITTKVLDEPNAYLPYFFAEIFNYGFINGLVVANISGQEEIQVFGYQPYPTLKVVELNNSTRQEQLFPDKTNNLYGYPIRTVFKYDYPRTFYLVDSDNVTVIKGYLANLLFSFAEAFNASFDIVGEIAAYDKFSYVDLVRTEQIDIGPHYSGVIGGVSTNSHAFGKLSVKVVAPQYRKVPRFKYLLKPFDLMVWTSLCVFTGYASAIQYVQGKMFAKHTSMHEAFTDVFAGLLYQGVSKFRFDRWRFSIIHLQVLIMGFILVNMYLANLSTYLTVELYEKPLQTYEQIKQAGLKIMAENTSMYYYFKDKLLPAKYDKYFFKVGADTLLSHVDRLNTSYAYALTQDRMELLAFRQKNFKYPPLHETKILLTEICGFLPVLDRWVLREKFNDFMLKLIQTGLPRKWLDDVSGERMFEIVSGLGEDLEAMALSMNHLGFAWYSLLCGLLLSCVCFGFELIFPRLIKKSQASKSN